MFDAKISVLVVVHFQHFRPSLYGYIRRAGSVVALWQWVRPRFKFKVLFIDAQFLATLANIINGHVRVVDHVVVHYEHEMIGLLFWHLRAFAQDRRAFTVLVFNHHDNAITKLIRRLTMLQAMFDNLS